MIQKMAAPDCC